jgi:FKBP-type peptidyl-prolyl cis-trans isomerase
MKEGEEAVVFFSSDYGYGYSTSGEIQPYSMLRFYIKVEHIGEP